MVGVLSNKISREELRPGDHIYTWRTFYMYSHHGIYMGDDEVIHFTRAEAGTGSSSFKSTDTHRTCNRCILLMSMSQAQNQSAGVISTCLDHFLSGGNLYQYTYSTSKTVFLLKSPGTCTQAPSDPPSDVLRRAHFLITYGFGNYSLFKNNCEDFAIYCKTGIIFETGIGTSNQITGQIASFRASGLLIPVVFIIPLCAIVPVVGAAAYGFCVATSQGFYLTERYRNDIANRRGGIKVPVEYLDRFEAATVAAITEIN